MSDSTSSALRLLPCSMLCNAAFCQVLRMQSEASCGLHPTNDFLFCGTQMVEGEGFTRSRKSATFVCGVDGVA